MSEVAIDDCFACGRHYSRGDGRFCSSRCRTAFDDGFPPYEPVPTLKDGVTINCYGCHKPFVSRGLRCCSPDCEKKYREHEDIAATLAEAGIEPSTKRACEKCSAHIPKWTATGRLTKKSVRLCPKCVSSESRKSRRGGGNVPEPAIDGQNP